MAVFPPIRLRAALTLGGLGVRELVVRTWTKVNENEIMTRAAAVAFYAMMALVPFLVVLLTLTSGLLPDLKGPSGAKIAFANMTVGELRQTLHSVFPSEASNVIEGQVTRIQQQPTGGLVSLGLAVTLWLASSLFLAVIDAMDRIYGVVETRSFLKRRLTAMLMTVVEAVILVGSLLAIVAFPELARMMGLSPPAAALATVVQWIAVVVMVLLSFALCFFVGPDADQRWEWITPGSLAGTAVFLLISLGFRVYVQDFARYDRTYGSLGGVMMLMFWFWMSSLVLLTAAQINKLIEDASPLGRKFGQKNASALAPDFEAMTPEATGDRVDRPVGSA
jgi:membrane protein